MNSAAKQRFSNNKLAKRLERNTGRAITEYNMIGEGDLVMVCLSGGKDSYTLLDILLTLQKRAPVRFELIAVNLDQKQPGFPADVLPRYAHEMGVPFYQIEQDTYSVVKRVIPEGKTTCDGGPEAPEYMQANGFSTDWLTYGLANLGYVAVAIVVAAVFALRSEVP